MADITPSKYIIISSYGGQKTAYVEFDTVTAADVMKFADENVAGIKHLDLRADDDGAAVPGVIAGADKTDITVGAGPAAEKVTGIIVFRSY